MKFGLSGFLEAVAAQQQYAEKWTALSPDVLTRAEAAFLKGEGEPRGEQLMYAYGSFDSDGAKNGAEFALYGIRKRVVVGTYRIESVVAYRWELTRAHDGVETRIQSEKSFPDRQMAEEHAKLTLEASCPYTADCLRAVAGSWMPNDA